jgi:hypothetical protein
VHVSQRPHSINLRNISFGREAMKEFAAWQQGQYLPPSVLVIGTPPENSIAYISLYDGKKLWLMRKGHHQASYQNDIVGFPRATFCKIYCWSHENVPEIISLLTRMMLWSFSQATFCKIYRWSHELRGLWLPVSNTSCTPWNLRFALGVISTS